MGFHEHFREKPLRKIYSPIFYQVDLANAEDLTWLEVTPRDELLWQQFLVTLSNG